MRVETFFAMLAFGASFSFAAPVSTEAMVKRVAEAAANPVPVAAATIEAREPQSRRRKNGKGEEEEEDPLDPDSDDATDDCSFIRDFFSLGCD